MNGTVPLFQKREKSRRRCLRSYCFIQNTPERFSSRVEGCAGGHREKIKSLFKKFSACGKRRFVAGLSPKF